MEKPRAAYLLKLEGPSLAHGGVVMVVDPRDGGGQCVSCGSCAPAKGMTMSTFVQKHKVHSGKHCPETAGDLPPGAQWIPIGEIRGWRVVPEETVPAAVKKVLEETEGRGSSTEGGLNQPCASTPGAIAAAMMGQESAGVVEDSFALSSGDDEEAGDGGDVGDGEIITEKKLYAECGLNRNDTKCGYDRNDLEKLSARELGALAGCAYVGKKKEDLVTRVMNMQLD